MFSTLYVQYINITAVLFEIFIAVQLIYNVVLVSGAQQSESVIYICIFTLFQILSPYRPLQSTEQSSLCYTIGSYQLSILQIVVCLGEGNGNPLQYSCLENPMDGGAWQAAVRGVTQSRTRLKRLSSSSVFTSIPIFQLIPLPPFTPW